MEGNVISIDEERLIPLYFNTINEFITYYYGDKFTQGLEQTCTIITGYYEDIVTIPPNFNREEDARVWSTKVGPD